MLHIQLYPNFSDYTEISSNLSQYFREDLLITPALKGSLKSLNVDKGATIVIWAFEIPEGITLSKETCCSDSDEYYIIRYFLSPVPAHMHLKKSMGAKVVTRTEHQNIFLYGSLPHSVKYEGGITKGLSILFTKEWLKQQFLNTGISPDLDWLQQFDHYSLHQNTASEQIAIKKLFDDVHASKPLLTIKTYFYSLFYQKILDISTQYNHPETEEKKDEATMIELEKEILSYLNSKMPSLDELSHKYCMSTSTLKRHFKRTFGTSIYEYYLSKKMENAHQLLDMHKMSVKEIAYQLGYESVSHFIFIYKKFYGCSPLKKGSNK